MKPHSVILKYISKLVFILINIFALYLFFKGHNEPGGGFIAGIASAISLVLLGMTLGLDAIKRLIFFDSVTIATCGLLIAYGTSVAPIFFGYPFLYHTMVHLHLPLLGEIHVGTPTLFDLGVFFVVVGIASKAMFTFSYSIEQKLSFVTLETDIYAPKGETSVEINTRNS